MFDMVKVLANYIRVARVAPEREIGKRKGQWMIAFLVMLAHVRIYVSAASNLLAFNTHPVFFFMSTVFAAI